MMLIAVFYVKSYMPKSTDFFQFNSTKTQQHEALQTHIKDKKNQQYQAKHTQLNRSVHFKLYKKPLAKSSIELSQIPYRIIYESYTDRNWDLYTIKADGTDKVNITNTNDIHEMYPKISPSGKKICFVVDSGLGRKRKRSVYIMDIDGSNRKLIAENARQPSWSSNGKYIIYVKSESTRRFSLESWATKGLYIYDIKTEESKAHPNRKLSHLYSLSSSPDGKYITATVLGAMGYKHTNIAIEVNTKKYFKIGIIGCRPEFSPDGRLLAWGRSDTEFQIAKINLKKRPPVRYKDIKTFIRIKKGYEIYHLDWSPDGKYMVFAYGPEGEQAVGGKSPGWNLSVAEVATGKWTMITNDGNHNREPDWIPLKD